jgi:hypothetical protein
MDAEVQIGKMAGGKIGLVLGHAASVPALEPKHAGGLDLDDAQDDVADGLLQPLGGVPDEVHEVAHLSWEGLGDVVP